MLRIVKYILFYFLTCLNLGLLYSISLKDYYTENIISPNHTKFRIQNRYKNKKVEYIFHSHSWYVTFKNKTYMIDLAAKNLYELKFNLTTPKYLNYSKKISSNLNKKKNKYKIKKKSIFINSISKLRHTYIILFYIASTKKLDQDFNSFGYNYFGSGIHIEIKGGKSFTYLANIVKNSSIEVPYDVIFNYIDAIYNKNNLEIVLEKQFYELYVIYKFRFDGKNISIVDKIESGH